MTVTPVLNKGTWYCVVSWYGEDGKRRQRWEKVGREADGVRKEQAKATAATILADYTRGITATPGNKKLVGDAADAWLDAAASRVRPKVHMRYRQLAARITKKFGTRTLSAVRQDEVNRYYRHLLGGYHSGMDTFLKVRFDGQEKFLAPQTVVHIHRVFVAIYNHAISLGWLGHNPIAKVKPPRVDPEELTVLDAAGVTRLLDVAKTSHYHPIIAVAVFTGLRRSEVLALRVRDVDLAGKRLNIARTVHYYHPSEDAALEYAYAAPKSKQSRRMITMGDALTGILRAHLEKLEAQLAQTGQSLDPDRLLFGTIDNHPLRPDTLSSRFHRIAKRAGYPTLRFHDLRHTHVTLLLGDRVPVKVVAERVGHSTPAFTLSRYGHVIPGMDEAAAASFDTLIMGSVEAEQERQTVGG